MPWFLPGFPSPWPPASLRYCSLLLGLLLPSWWSSHCSLLPSSIHLPLWHQRDHVTLPPIPTPFKAFLRLLLVLQRKSSLSKMASEACLFWPSPFLSSSWTGFFLFQSLEPSFKLLSCHFFLFSQALYTYYSLCLSSSSSTPLLPVMQPLILHHHDWLPCWLDPVAILMLS